jgi:hypothetical protein
MTEARRGPRFALKDGEITRGEFASVASTPSSNGVWLVVKHGDGYIGVELGAQEARAMVRDLTIAADTMDPPAPAKSN